MSYSSVEYHLKYLKTKIIFCQDKINKESNTIKLLSLYEKINKYNEEYKKIYYSIQDFIKCKITKNNTNMRFISHKKMNELEKQTCPICLSNHKCKDLIETNCKHLFGKSCFRDLMKITDKYKYCLENKCHFIKCPMCRKSKLRLIRYVVDI
jgi:hypothetical protein